MEVGRVRMVYFGTPFSNHYTQLSLCLVWGCPSVHHLQQSKTLLLLLFTRAPSVTISHNYLAVSGVILAPARRSGQFLSSNRGGVEEGEGGGGGEGGWEVTRGLAGIYDHI